MIQKKAEYYSHPNISESGFSGCMDKQDTCENYQLMSCRFIS